MGHSIVNRSFEFLGMCSVFYMGLKFSYAPIFIAIPVHNYNHYGKRIRTETGTDYSCPYVNPMLSDFFAHLLF